MLSYNIHFENESIFVFFNLTNKLPRYKDQLMLDFSEFSPRSNPRGEDRGVHFRSPNYKKTSIISFGYWGVQAAIDSC
jgi:hypothetical protein